MVKKQTIEKSVKLGIIACIFMAIAYATYNLQVAYGQMEGYVKQVEKEIMEGIEIFKNQTIANEVELIRESINQK